MTELLELQNNYIENLKYQISLKSIRAKTYKKIKKIPVFTELMSHFNRPPVGLAGNFGKSGFSAGISSFPSESLGLCFSLFSPYFTDY